MIAASLVPPPIIFGTASIVLSIAGRALPVFGESRGDVTRSHEYQFDVEKNNLQKRISNFCFSSGFEVMGFRGLTVHRCIVEKLHIFVSRSFLSLLL